MGSRAIGETSGSWSERAERLLRDRQGRFFPFGSNFPLGGAGFVGGPGLRRRMKSRGGSIRTGEANKGRQSDQGLKMSKVEVEESIMFTIMLQSSQKRVHVKQINSIIVQPTFAYFFLTKCCSFPSLMAWEIRGAIYMNLSQLEVQLMTLPSERLFVGATEYLYLKAVNVKDGHCSNCSN